MTDQRRVANPLETVQLLPPGSGVILRDYEDPYRLDLAHQLAGLCKKRRLVFLVGDDRRLARRVNADGLHLPRWSKHRYHHRRSFAAPNHWILSASVHSLPELFMADRQNVDCVMVSPVFATHSHVGVRGLGPVKLAALARRAAAPVIALGGMERKTVMRLKDSGCVGIAAIGALRSLLPESTVGTNRPARLQLGP